MFRRGLAFCVSLAVASLAYGGVEVQLIPDNPGPYSGNENLSVDVVLVQDAGGTDHALRMVQLDLNDSDTNLGTTSTAPWDFSSTPACQANPPADCGTDHYIDDQWFSDPRPPGDKIIVIAFGSQNELGENTNKQLVLPGGDPAAPLKVATLNITLPSIAGVYTLDVVNADETDPDLAAQVRWGFGTNINGEPITTWRADSGDLTGGTLDLCVGAGCGVNLDSSAPACDVTLPRFTNNVLRLTFDNSIPDPVSGGQVEIRQLLAGGAFGADLSGSFTFTVEGGNVLRIEENGDVLSDATWYAVLNNGTWPGVNDFEVDYPVVVGDSNNDGFNDFADLSAIFANQTGSAADDDRYDINADGFVDFSDLSAAFGFNGTFAPAKPDGHACNP